MQLGFAGSAGRIALAGVAGVCLSLVTHIGRAGDDATVLRETADINAETRAGAQMPDDVTYETWFRGGTRVDFGHALHADTLGLACGECHHTETCSRCHQPAQSPTLVRDAQVAVHEVCFRCHAQELRGASCGVCHRARSGGDAGAGNTGVAASPKLGRDIQDWLLETIEQHADSLVLFGEHAPRQRVVGEPPAQRVFVTSRSGVSVVAFGHQEHAEGAGIACASCHHVERCGVCHADTQRKVSVRATQEAVMQNCVRCHDHLGLSTDCGACHTDPHRR